MSETPKTPTEPNIPSAVETPATPETPAEPPAAVKPPAEPTPPVDAKPPVEPKAAVDPKPGDETDPPQERVVPKASEYTLPEGMPIQVAEWANQNGFTQEQLDNTLQYFQHVTTSSKDAEFKTIRQQGEAFVKSWGDKGEYNLSIVRRALAQNDPDGSLKDLLEMSGYGNHPAVEKDPSRRFDRSRRHDAGVRPHPPA